MSRSFSFYDIFRFGIPRCSVTTHFQATAEDSERHARYLKFRSVRTYALRKFTFRKMMKRRVDPIDAEATGPARNEPFVVQSQGSKEASASVAFTRMSSDVESSLASEADTVINALVLPPEVQSEYLSKKLRENYVRMCVWPGNLLDHRESKLDLALHHSSMGSAWFTSTPLSAASTFRVFQFFEIVIGCFFFVLGLNSSAFETQDGHFALTQLKVEVLSLRKSNITPTNAQVASIGLLNDGCVVSVHSETIVQNSTFVVSFPSEVVANGYFFFTSTQSPAFDPVRWVVSVATPNSTWRTVGASVWRWGMYSERELHPGMAFDTPVDRMRRIDLDLSMTWPVRLLTFTGGVEWALAFWSSVILAWTGREYLIKGLFSLIAAGDLVFIITAVVGFGIMGNTREVIFSVGILGLEFIMFLTFSIFESRVVTMLLAYSVLYVTVYSLEHYLLYNVEDEDLAAKVFSSPVSVTTCVSLLLLYFRFTTLRKSRRLISPDIKLYETMWSRLIYQNESKSQLEELQRAVSDAASKLQVEFPMSQPRQKKHSSVSTFQQRELVGGELSEELGIFDRDNLISSLDHLFIQADCMQLVLLQKVKEWAMACGGMFPLKGSSEYVQICDVVANPQINIKFAKMKSVARALEKVVRSYGQDPSRLVDVCRQSVIFDDMAGIARCLSVLCADSEVVLLRLKNRLDPSYDAARLSGGYRDIAINLRIVNAQTMDLGIDTHVCELQLLIRPFAELKSDEGHKRYVTFRNLRGE
mmetsp:Transcript_60146/g.159854  ORF Transcript_60146/g.159854 Transcript_60146/m.159854 type:complete len:757 (+) Transcript_60146:2012-4282(+)